MVKRGHFIHPCSKSCPPQSHLWDKHCVRRGWWCSRAADQPQPVLLLRHMVWQCDSWCWLSTKEPHLLQHHSIKCCFLNPLAVCWEWRNLLCPIPGCLKLKYISLVQYEDNTILSLYGSKFCKEHSWWQLSVWFLDPHSLLAGTWQHLPSLAFGYIMLST